MDVHFLAELPLNPEIRAGGDTGKPIVLRNGDGAPFLELARNTVSRVAEASQQVGPKIEISE